MKENNLSLMFFAAAISLVMAGPVRADDKHTLENKFLGRVLSTEGGVLKTVEVINKRTHARMTPTEAPEFRLRISQGTHRPDTAFTLTASDFKVVKATKNAQVLAFSLENTANNLKVELKYELLPEDFYLRKKMTITSGKDRVLERIDVEALTFSDAYQPYKKREIYASGTWKIGLGQPLYASKSATFWGVEFPAADNTVKEGAMTAGYLWGRELKANQPYIAYSAVMGVADDPQFMTEAFFSYIDRIRVRPLRLQVQYNTWFADGEFVDAKSFAKSAAKIHQELVVDRGNKPLKMYVIDDGWQDNGSDWSEKMWKVNSKFDQDFAAQRKVAADVKSRFGLWLSPGVFFGANRQVAELRKKGFEALDSWMSMAGPRYMQALEDRVVELQKQGAGYFKFDGLFGQLFTRDFEVHGAKYGLPEMPQLGTDGFKSADGRLNDPKFDELKIYYLTAGSERLMQMFRKMAETDPDTYIAITNGAYLSPWWLMYVDIVWLINSSDEAGGKSRTAELVYRDSIYNDIWLKENTQFPMSSIFNHEPKKIKTGESKDDFRRYLYMNLSRGTGFVELYIKPTVLQPGDWDVLSEGLFWVEDVFPTFKRAQMHGGNPGAKEVYGFSGWDKPQGYISIHNPSDVAKPYAITLDRSLGLIPGSGPFLVSSPIDGCAEGLPTSCNFGDKLTLELKPREIRIIHFSVTPKDWSKLKKLQSRSPETSNAAADGAQKPASTPVEKHAILGTWSYSGYTRSFTKDGICTLRNGETIIWEKPFKVDGPDQVTVEDGLVHKIKPDGTLDIEGNYTAKRKDP